jgi:hypothetical protein
MVWQKRKKIFPLQRKGQHITESFITNLRDAEQASEQKRDKYLSILTKHRFSYTLL